MTCTKCFLNVIIVILQQREHTRIEVNRVIAYYVAKYYERTVCTVGLITEDYVAHGRLVDPWNCATEGNICIDRPP